MPNETSQSLARSITKHLGTAMDSLAAVEVSPGGKRLLMTVADAVERRATINGINKAAEEYGLENIVREAGAGRENTVVVSGKDLSEEELPLMLRTSLEYIRDHLAIEKDAELAARTSQLREGLGHSVHYSAPEEKIVILANDGDRPTLLEQQRKHHPLLKNIDEQQQAQLTVVSSNNLLSYVELKSFRGNFSGLLTAVDSIIAQAEELKDILDQRPDRSMASAPEIEIIDESAQGLSIMPTLTIDPVAYAAGRPLSTLNPPPKPRRR